MTVRAESLADEVERLTAERDLLRARLTKVYGEVSAVVGPVGDVDDPGLAGALLAATAAQRAARRARGETQPTAATLAEFHTRPGYDQARPPEPTLDVPGIAQRAEFVVEGVLELREAVAAGDLVKVADALADVVYTAYGTAWRTGTPLDAVTAEVHRSNMSKTPAPGDGKAAKGPGCSPPETAGALGLESSG